MWYVFSNDSELDLGEARRSDMPGWPGVCTPSRPGDASRAEPVDRASRACEAAAARQRGSSQSRARGTTAAESEASGRLEGDAGAITSGARCAGGSRGEAVRPSACSSAHGCLPVPSRCGALHAAAVALTKFDGEVFGTEIMMIQPFS